VLTATAKSFRAGTHRVRSPAETWEWLRELLPRAGITRVADVTALDRIGIPVWQAVRPASRNLSVSQGKGATPEAARVSAAMEAVELWHAEDLGHLPAVVMSPREMRYDNAIPLAALRWKPRLPEVSAVPMPWVRARQRELAEAGDAVIEGRDIGTVVCPDADVKVYLNAERQIRAERRLAERPEIGADALATDLRLRDESDAARMRPAEDAVQIDTTELDVEDVVGRIEQLVRERQPA
jgi:Cytidylate kinase/YcaO cyclodehydratase, ATP-ad Mg2+-binding